MSENFSRIVKAKDLKVGDNLVYKAHSLKEASATALFTRNDSLVGEIVELTPATDSISIKLAFGRSLVVAADCDCELEVPERSIMVAHRGTPQTFKGISLE